MIFNIKIKKDMTITCILLSVGIFLTLIGLYKGIKIIDPKYFVALATLIGFSIAIFGVLGKLYQDVKSGKKQDSILENTIVSLQKSVETIEKVTQTLELSKGIDLVTSETKDNTISLKEQNIELIDKVSLQEKLIDKLRIENNELSARLYDKSLDIYKNITGGDAFPFVDFLIFERKNEEPQKYALITKNEFDLPVYNVHIEGYDFELLKSKKYNFTLNKEVKEAVHSSDFNSSNIFVYHADLLNPRGGEIDSENRYEVKKEKFYITINTKNKTLVQKAIIDKFENKFYVAFQIVDMKGRILKEHFYDDKITKEGKSFLRAKLNEIPNSLPYYIRD